MASVKDRLSLDWLREARAKSSTSPAPTRSGTRSADPLSSSLEEALITYGGPLLRELRERGGAARLHELLQVLQLQLSDALPLLDYFVERGDLEFDQDQDTGNYLVRLTKHGQAVAARMR